MRKLSGMNLPYSRRDFLTALGGLPLARLVERNPVLDGKPRHRWVPHYRQRHTLSCEMAALHMAADYFGRNVSEEQLIEMLPVHEAPPRLAPDGRMIWGDPNRAFVGSIDGKQIWHDALEQYPPGTDLVWKWGYGVYPPVIAEVATRLNLPAYLLDSLEDVYEHLERGNPVISIVPHAGETEALTWAWFTERGDRVPVIDREHAVVIRPLLNEDYVYVNDPGLYPEDLVWKYRHVDFRKAFEVLSRAVAIGQPRWVMPANAL